MEDSSLLKIISEKFVKPSSPTPPSSRYYKLCVFDLHVGDSFIPLALFYPKGCFHSGNSSRTELFELLETSLSKTLTYYHPFAGRFMDDNITVDCNDAGVQLCEVQIQSSMSEILDSCADYHPWNSVFLHEMYRCAMSHVMIQLSYFDCGGICIIISLSHKLGDVVTLVNFMNDWAMIARGSQDAQAPAPILFGASIFPPPNDLIKMSMNEGRSNHVTQRFVFSASSISALKEKVVRETEIKNPTQVEVVTAFIFKYVMSAAQKLNSSSGSFQPSSLMQVVNFRPVTIPPLSMQMVGNFVNNFVITVTEEKERELSIIVTKLRKSKVKYMDTHKARLEGNEFMNRCSKFWEKTEKKLKGNNFDKYICSSWFRFPLYEADFGFGKPIFVCQTCGSLDRIIFLMGTPKGDEIGAFVTLKSDQMSILEKDKELLTFASLNPKICGSRL